LLGWARGRGREEDALPEGLPSAEVPDTSEHNKCVSWAEFGYCYAGPSQQYMMQSCAAECDQGQRAGTIPEPGKLWQASVIECQGYRMRGACESHAGYMCAARAAPLVTALSPPSHPSSEPPPSSQPTHPGYRRMHG
jgi:hypothetical protein